MTFSPTSRRWITPAVLAGYMLVITFSGLFHQHDGGNCCSGKGCSRSVADDQGPASDHSACEGHGPHHHHHRGHDHHAGSEHCHHKAEPASERPAGPRTDDPLKHDHCAACQLLAEQSLSTPTFELECAGIAVFREDVAAKVRVPSVLFPAHPGRGPPAAG